MKVEHKVKFDMHVMSKLLYLDRCVVSVWITARKYISNEIGYWDWNQ